MTCVARCGWGWQQQVTAGGGIRARDEMGEMGCALRKKRHVRDGGGTGQKCGSKEMAAMVGELGSWPGN